MRTNNMTLEEVVLKEICSHLEIAVKVESFGEKEVRVRVDTDKLIKGISYNIETLGSYYLDYCGLSYGQANRINQDIRDADIYIHIDDYIIHAERKYMQERITTDLGHKRVKGL